MNDTDLKLEIAHHKAATFVITGRIVELVRGLGYDVNSTKEAWAIAEQLHLTHGKGGENDRA